MTENEKRALFARLQDIGRAMGFDRLTDLHGKWLWDMLFGEGDRTLQAHRGSYKTTCVQIALASAMLLWPERNILFMRKTYRNVTEVLRAVRAMLLSDTMADLSCRLHGVPPEITTANNGAVSTGFGSLLRGTPQLTGLGIRSALTGRHFDMVFTDDIVDITDRLSAAERSYTAQVYQELQNVRNRGGRIFNTGTPWHKDDCFRLMPDIRRYDCYETGLIDEQQLAALRRTMTPSLFAANYELRHIADADVLFPDPAVGAPPESVRGGTAHIDAAYGGSDSTALTVGMQDGGKYYLYGRLWHRAVWDLTDELTAECRRLCVRRVLCETNGDKGYLARSLRERGLHTAAYHEQTDKYHKITAWLRGAWDNILFTADTDGEYIEQIAGYCAEAAHDDAPDSAASLLRALAGKSEGRRGSVMW